MSVLIELSPQEIADIKQVTRLQGDADAVAKAAREFLRLSRLRELKAASGNVEFESNWQHWEDIELSETDLPR